MQYLCSILISSKQCQGKEKCMSKTSNINRLDYIILQTIYTFGCINCYNSITISELMEENSQESKCILGSRMTIYKKLKKLVENAYIKKGIKDNHADTYYIIEKGIDLIEKGEKNEFKE